MPPYRKPDVRDILKKHGARIERQIKTSDLDRANYSREYMIFKDEMAPEFSRYENWCHKMGNIIRLRPSKKDELKIGRQLQIAHVDVTAGQALSLGFMAMIGVLLLGVLVSVAIALVKGGFSEFPYFFLFLTIILSVVLFYFLNAIPNRLANKWRLKASSQMVPAILYVVVYMRHTPNLEKAIAFASQHLQYPLALDFKKVFYDVEIGKFSSIKESLDNYLETWRGFSTEFIESFHLIESSLFEPDNSRRISTLEKSLQVVLDGVYDKMLKFTHSVRSPLTNVYMLGVVLPTLGLALLPLASAMIGEFLKVYHIFILFNLIIPFLVFYLTDKIMMLRPGGYGESTLLERNPLYPEYKSKKHYSRAFLICLPFLIIGLLPLIFQFTPIPDMFGLQKDYSFAELGLGFLGEGNAFDFMTLDNGSVVGPYGVGALFLGLFFPLGLALFFSLAFKNKTKELIKERKRTKQLEGEFNNSLFQLGNRLGNGVPAELVFGKIAESSKGLMTEDFFRKVNYNIKQMGMGVEGAIFDSRRGAINYYPSDLIATSMRVLVESVKKGLKIAAISLMSISEYVKNIQKITNRLKDLLAEIVSDMKSNMTFLAPLLSGIVVGLAVMITSILTKLNLAQISGEGAAQLGGFSGITNLFNLTSMIPPYYLQIAVGIYLIQVIFILTGTLVTIDSGADKLEKTNKTGKNLTKGILLFFITSLLATAALFILSSIVLGGL
ncbi:hypothetical protein ACFLZJ_00075 [Nanoarchaeota archaeon]